MAKVKKCIGTWILDEDFPCDITKAQMYRIADTWEKLEKM